MQTIACQRSRFILDHGAQRTAAHHFARKALRHLSLATPRAWADQVRYALHKTPADRTLLTEQIASGEAILVTVDGVKATYYTPASVVPVLEELAAGKTPDDWQTADKTTEQEVGLLSPLDNLLHDRERALAVFEFEYVWEVYKPAHLRRWGRYTMPVLYGDRLVARIEPRLDRRAGTLGLQQVWFEDPALEHDTRFKTAFTAGLQRFAEFLRARLVL
jgi:uncharacterized protein YcaQ